MASRRPARLFLKHTGIFYVRVLLPPVNSSRNRTELRRSLGTKNALLARSLSSALNALLESELDRTRRKDLVEHFFRNTIATWTLPGGLSASDEDDQRRLSRFLKDHPLIEQAIA